MFSRFAATPLLQESAKALSIVILAGVFCVSASTQSLALQVNDFQGPYDPSNWTTTLPGSGTGSVVPSGTPTDQIVITEPTDVGEQISFTIAAAGPGTFSFNWAVTDPGDGARLNVFVNSATPTVFCNATSCSGSGDGAGGSVVVNSGGFGSFTNIPVDTGDTIGWAVVNTNASAADPAKWTITNFSAPAAIPVPPALLLMVSALVAFCGIGRVGRRHWTAKSA